MRDLYNRKVKLERWIQRIQIELADNEADKQNILKFVDYLREKDKNVPGLSLQNKAFLACLDESGNRPEEFLRLSNLDCRIDTNGAILFLRGKTGERRIRIVSFALN